MPKVPDENDLIYDTYGVDFGRIFRAIYEMFGGTDWDALVTTLAHWWNIYSVIAILLSLLFFVGFVYSKIRYSQLSEIEQEALRDAEARWAARHANKASKNARWEGIQSKVTENNPESWRLAIIEADILLDETLTNAGYVGQSIGDKLKTANPISFTTVQDAWEAHKVRNEIAHVGSDFVLTKKNAQDTLLRYERVFHEFGVV
jgi:hypothetical protein